MTIIPITFFLVLSALHPSMLYAAATLSWCFIALWYNSRTN